MEINICRGQPCENPFGTMLLISMFSHYNLGMRQYNILDSDICCNGETSCFNYHAKCYNCFIRY
jgi:hypothetical protein